MFVGVAGSQKVDLREYVLQDADEKKDIDFRLPIHDHFRPGSKITMGMIFREGEIIRATCPKCGSRVIEELNKDTHW